ncbi:S41 family peptidase [Marinicella sediminis]|uniref:S41 family peptidase n=1 Tax=Marinicella sediminis TaxID=1792834 RepID=A0ABV7JDA4_9GAMM|nr:S41 family peptidase [Marinicella sediminis]
MKSIITTIALFTLVACTSTFNKSSVSKNKQPSTDLNDQLLALAKLYGYVRYFHPTDEAMVVDWDAFLVHSINEVKKQEQPLDKTLDELFKPITQHVQVLSIYDSTPITKLEQPTKAAQLKYWQHHGLGDDAPAAYHSSRVGDVPATPLNAFATWLEVQDIANHQYRLSARVKVMTDQVAAGGRLTFSAFSPAYQTFGQNTLTDHLITDNEWQTVTLTGQLTEDAIFLIVGAELVGKGQMWVDDFALEVSADGEHWQSIPVPNHQFNADPDDDSGQWRFNDSALYQFEVVNEQDNKVMQITGSEWAKPGAIFKQQESMVYTVQEKALNEDWKVHLPITVWDMPGEQLNTAYELLNLQLTHTDMTAMDGTDEALRIANTIIMWAVLNHFYPYFDVVDVDWDAALHTALTDALNDQNEIDHINSLQRLMARIQDGHGVVFAPESVQLTGVPVAVQLVGDELVVTGSRLEAIQRGDVITAVDGTAAMSYFHEQKLRVSGSPQLVQFRALNQLGLGEMNDNVTLSVQRGTDLFDHVYTRTPEQSGWSNLFFNAVSEQDFMSIDELEPGIFYVNLKKITKQQFADHLDQLASAQGIIFDQRWDGKRNNEGQPLSVISDLLPHLTDTTITSGNWQIPQIHQPDQKDVTFSINNWDVAPKTPYFKGQKVFINLPSVVSSGETFSGMVDHYDLAEFVGEPTAGCNGNINYIYMLNGYRAMFTGMKVEKHDGSQLHLIGYEPDHPVEVSKAGILNGNDEYLTTALEVIKQMSSSN